MLLLQAIDGHLREMYGHLSKARCPEEPWQVLGEPVALARGEQNAIFRAFRYAREQIPWL